jgi:hypothetical protein
MELKRVTKILFFLFSVFVFLPFGEAIAEPQVRTETVEGFDVKSIKRVAFIPFTRVDYIPGTDRRQCPIAQMSCSSCKIENHAESDLSRLFGSEFYLSGVGIEWVPQKDLNDARSKIKKEKPLLFSLQGSWQQELGQNANADAVLTGYIYCYRERSGNAAASETPAAISLSLHLMDPYTGKVYWTIYYEDEQEPLSENLKTLPTFVKRKGKWVEVTVLGEEAAKKTVEELPWNNKKPLDDKKKKKKLFNKKEKEKK